MLLKHEDFWGLPHYYLWGVRNFHKSLVKDQYKKVLVELELSAGLSVCSVFPGTDKASWLEAVLGKFPPRISMFCCSGISSRAWDCTQQTLPSLGNFSHFWGVVLSWNSCCLWEKSRARAVLCFQPLTAAVLGFEASALGTASGRGVWSEEVARQGMEGLLLLPWAPVCV